MANRIGKLFNAKSLKVDKSDILENTGGHYENLNLSTFLFIYQSFKVNKSAIKKVCLNWCDVKGYPTLELRPKKNHNNTFDRLREGIRKYRNADGAHFFMWGRSYKEKSRKVPYQKIWEFNANNDGKSLYIPLDKEFYKEISKERFSVSIWAPHKIENDHIQIQPDYYPASEDWSIDHKVFVEWTKQPVKKEQKSVSNPHENMIENILDMWTKTPEKELVKIITMLRRTLQRELGGVCHSMEVLASQSKVEFSVEDKIRLLSLLLFNE